jgi:hypothetical protein
VFNEAVGDVLVVFVLLLLLLLLLLLDTHQILYLFEILVVLKTLPSFLVTSFILTFQLYALRKSDLFQSNELFSI